MESLCQERPFVSKTVINKGLRGKMTSISDAEEASSSVSLIHCGSRYVCFTDEAQNVMDDMPAKGLKLNVA